MISSLSGASGCSALSYLQSLTGADSTASTDSASGTGSSASTSFESQLFSQMDENSDGTVTKTEFTDAIQSLVNQLLGQMQQSLSSGTATGGITDATSTGKTTSAPGADGLTADQLSSMASATSGTDSNASTLFASLADDFDTADSDGNGKVGFQEAMAYKNTYLSATQSTSGGTLSIAA